MLPSSFTFDLYPYLIAVGVILALVFLDIYFKKVHLKKGMSTDFEILFVISAAIGIMCAVLFQNLYNLIESPSTYTWTWAMTFFGGLVGGFATFMAGYYFVLRKKYPKSFVVIATIAGPGLPLAHGIGRIGCTLDGCCYGSPIAEDSPFYWMGIQFKTTTVKVWPTQLMEAIFLLVLAGILYYLAFKKNTRYNLAIYGLSYGLFRFLIEFLRGDHRGNFIPGITPSQAWAIALFVASLIYLIMIIRSKKYTIFDFDLPFEKPEEKKEPETEKTSI